MGRRSGWLASRATGIHTVRKVVMDRIRLFPTPLNPLLLSLAALLLSALAGCAGSGPDEEAPASPAAGQDEASAPTPAGPAVYAVRGQVVEVPDPEDPLSGFFVHHEPIDDFRDMDGNVVGMDSMTMPFPIADDVSFEGVAEGDAVVFTLEVNWDGDPQVQVTSVESLPAGTELEFRNARPPGEEGEPGGSGEQGDVGRGPES